MSTDRLTVGPIAVSASGRTLPRPNSALGFALLGIACWLFAATIALLVLTKASVMANSDLSIDTPLQNLGTSVGLLGDWALVWQRLGGPVGSTILIVVVTLALFVARRPWWATYLIACAVGGLVIAEALKRTIDRPRPTWSDPLYVETGGSFPSGHSMVGIYGFAVIGVIAIFLIKRPLGTWVGWILIVIGISMAPSRLILGVHWPSDVVGGWMLALGWVLLVSAVGLTIAYRRQGVRTEPETEQSKPTP